MKLFKNMSIQGIISYFLVTISYIGTMSGQTHDIQKFSPSMTRYCEDVVYYMIVMLIYMVQKYAILITIKFVYIEYL